MKKIILTLLSVAVAPAVFAQGAFFCNNFSAAPGTGEVFYDSDGAGPNLPVLAPTGLFSIDIYWGVIGTLEAALQPINSPVPVGDVSDGYYDGGTATIPTGVGTPASVLIQFRAVTGPYIGRSSIITQPLSYSPNTPSDPVLGPSWVVAVPEPSTFALAGLGSAALLVFRRRK